MHCTPFRTLQNHLHETLSFQTFLKLTPAHTPFKLDSYLEKILDVSINRIL
eukprot:jgi/Bigna1/63323/fgenesh1_kg.51_\